jgi:hypothetical protein
LTKEHPRIKREKKTIEAMVRLYCKKKHQGKKELCPECTEFMEYARMRLDKCPFQEKKTTCAHCLIHCYQPQMREKAKKIMRYSGPRMLLHHPVLALHHVYDGFKKPEKPPKKAR